VDPRRRAWIAPAIVFALLGVGPQAAPRVPFLLAHRGAGPVLAVVGGPADAAAVVGLVATILRRDLGLPLPARITARVADGPARFEQALATHGAVPVERAAEFARFAAGAAIPGVMFLRKPAPLTGQPEWTRLIGHELTHLAQMELAGTEIGPAPWLAEGMAEWVASTVLERLRLADLQRQRAAVAAGAREYVRRTGGLDLDALATPVEFVTRHRRVGTRVTYQLARYLTDDLVARGGFPALVEYFWAFRSSDDAAANFAASFGLSLDAFEQAASTRLARAPATNL
jgi:hypothetical protein